MISTLDTYLGWEKPQHHAGCKRPAWDVGIRTEERAARYVGRGDSACRHSCPDECCSHGNAYDQVVVRIVCTSCGAARVVTGEHTEDTGTSTTSTKVLGYGLPPRQVAELLLWPGQPWLPYGRALAEEPHDFVLTRTGVKQVTEDAVVGQITQSRGGRGGVVWTALAVPDPQGQFGYGQRLRWAHANDGRGRGGSILRTVPAAARWIGARLAEQKPAAELAAGGAR
ncbi:ferredoxin-like protein FixX [Streptomyces achromogenes]|uniref:hypothetical protein n=1 Tax=Streptomyces achromogenes TaxID=67255 RepID=UPI0027876E88|nr:hypothetical protein [Streptomyces achromogenes]MDQ0829505.1 ferredoxin-like protein FixX [Streptomyces achromogenes]